MSQAKRQGVSKQKWTDEEEQALRQGVERFGVGKWRQIQKDDTLGPRLINRSNVDLKDKWRNLNMDAHGSRNDKRGSRAKGRGKPRHKAQGAAAAQEPTAAAGALGRDVPNRQRKRKRRPERAAEPGSPLPYRASSGALRALQDAALGAEADEGLPARRVRRRPRALVEDEDDEDDDDEGVPEEDEEEAELLAELGRQRSRRRPRQRRRSPLDDEEEDDNDGDYGGVGVDDDGEGFAGGAGEGDGLEEDGFEEDEEDLKDDELADGDPNNRTGPIPDDMVVAAIISLQDPLGSHPDDITTWIESHYSVAAAFKRTVRGTLRAMVEAGRLEVVPHHASLYRLGGVVRALSREAGVQWPRQRPGSSAQDTRTAVESAEAAAQAVAEAEEAAALATRLMEAANRYEHEAAAADARAPRAIDFASSSARSG